jgi:hypothetical protein
MFGLLTTLIQASFAPITISVEGEGYLRFALEGRVVYAKSARLVARDGKLVHEAGAALMPLVAVDENTNSVSVAGDGTIIATPESPKRLPKLLLARFPAGAQSTVDSGYVRFSQKPILGFPGTQGFGTISCVEDKSGGRRVVLANSAGGSILPNGNDKAFPSLTIVGLEKVELEGERCTLSQIADIRGVSAVSESLKKIDMGPTPQAGITQHVSESQIAAKIRQAGFDTASVRFEIKAPIEIRRKTQIVTHEQFLQAALDALSGDKTAWQCQTDGPDFLAPTGALQLKAENVNMSGSVATVTLAVFVNGKRVNSRTLRLTGNFSAGVKAGSAVKVRFVSGGAVGEISGRAKTSGVIGQCVDVMVSFDPSKPPTQHSGTVVAPGVVEVKLS